jgi:hypothetical protein
VRKGRQISGINRQNLPNTQVAPFSLVCSAGQNAIVQLQLQHLFFIVKASGCNEPYETIHSPYQKISIKNQVPINLV